MRCAIDNISEENSSAPRDALNSRIIDETRAFLSSSVNPLLLASASAKAFALPKATVFARSIRADTTPDNDVRATTIPINTATSSSSPTCDSRAADKNSPAMLNEIETDRSEPNPDKVAAELMPPPPPRDCLNSFRKESKLEPKGKFYCSTLMLQRICSSPKRMFLRPVLNRQPTCAYLQMFSQLISITSDFVDKSGRKRRITDTTLRDLGSECGGLVYGMTAGTLLAYCGCRKGVAPQALRVLHAALRPMSQAIVGASGVDAAHLCAGMFAHRQSRAQMNYVGSTEQASPTVSVQINRRFGSSSMLVGATIALFCVFTLLSNHTIALASGATIDSLNSDIEWMVGKKCLLDAAVNVAEAVKGAVPSHGFAAAPIWEFEAVSAELRALQRAIVGVRVAMEMARKNGLSPRDALTLQLDYFAKAAYPASVRLDAGTQSKLLNDVANPLFFHAQQNARPQTNPGSGGLVVPLSQLSSIAREGDPGGSEGSVTDASSVSHPLSNASSRNSDAASEAECFRVMEL